MTKKPYTLEDDEVNVLVRGVMEQGYVSVYQHIKTMALDNIQNIGDMDEILIDKHHYMLDRARNLQQDSQDEQDLQRILYQIASMFRVVAHEIHNICIKQGKNKDSEKFLKLVSYNKDIPKYEWAG